METPAAKIHIYKAGSMTKAQRKVIAKWLKEQARQFERIGETYTTGRFGATFYWRIEGDKL